MSTTASGLPIGDAEGSPELRDLYLDPADVGVSWLLDPDNDFVREILAGYENRSPTEPCDPYDLAADLDDALMLIKRRHIGIAEGEFTGPAMDEALEHWSQSWRDRLLADRPTTWGEAIGLDGYRLRRILGDSHCNIRGEDPERLRLADPRRHRPRVSDQGPAAEIAAVGDILCVRVRRLYGSPEQQAQLQQWADDHAQHFAYDKIIVDLRGNRGGGDGSYSPGSTRTSPTTPSWPTRPTPGSWAIKDSRPGTSASKSSRCMALRCLTSLIPQPGSRCIETVRSSKRVRIPGRVGCWSSPTRQ